MHVQRTSETTNLKIVLLQVFAQNVHFLTILGGVAARGAHFLAQVLGQVLHLAAVIASTTSLSVHQIWNTLVAHKTKQSGLRW